MPTSTDGEDAAEVVDRSRMVSFTWAGIKRTASGNPIAISGSVTRNTEPHQ